jgi:molecular chaperone DnaK (HSP70)
VDWYPSLVAEHDGEIRCGWAAHACLSDKQWSITRSFKRLLTDPTMRSDRNVRVGSLEMPLIDLLAAFLSELNRDLRTQSNVREALTGVERNPAWIATPANAHSTKRFFTIEAFRMAGFDVLALLNEPSAAGFEYAHRYRSSITSKREHIVVYDLGGGTFDASLVRMTGQHHDVPTTSGVSRLGGDDFDDVLADLVLAELGISEPLDDVQRARLVDACREAKEALGQASRRVLVDAEAALGVKVPTRDVALPVSKFYEACAGLIERTIEAMMQVVATDESDNSPPSGTASGPPSSPASGPPSGPASGPPSGTASAAASGTASGAAGSLPGVAGVYVVGGASELPAVGRMLRVRFGRRVHRSPYPSAAIAIGLAIAGDMDAGFRLTDRFSRAFGVFRELSDGAVVSFDPIFTKDTRIPTRQEAHFASSRTYRAAHNIGHFRYVECDTVDSMGSPLGDITPLADAIFPFDPKLCGQADDLCGVRVQRMSSPGPLVEEHYTVDANGMVAVLIRNLDAGYEKQFRLWG